MAAYEQYKDSGVKWLGEIPSHWELKYLRNFLSQTSEKNHPDEQLLSVTREKGVIVRGADENEENHNPIPEDLSGYKYVRKGDFVINKMKSWQGSYGLSFFDGIVSPAYYTFKLNFPCKEFFSRAIRSSAYIPFFAANSKGIRVGQWDLDIAALKSIPFAVPPIDEQEAIVAYLDKVTGEIDRAIEIQQQMIDALNERIQIIISNAVTKGLNPDAPLRDSGIDWLGQIPAHWQVRRIKTLFRESDERNNDLEYELLSFSRYKGIVPYSSISDRPAEGLDISKYKVIHPGQLLENRMQAWSGMFAESTIHGCVSPDYSVFSAINPDDTVEFFAMSFRTPKYIQQFANASKGIGDGFNRLYTPQFGAIYTLYPPQEEQKQIVREVGSSTKLMRDLIEQHLNMIDLLTERKQIIINQVVTGKEKVI